MNCLESFTFSLRVANDRWCIDKESISCYFLFLFVHFESGETVLRNVLMSTKSTRWFLSSKFWHTDSIPLSVSWSLHTKISSLGIAVFILHPMLLAIIPECHYGFIRFADAGYYRDDAEPVNIRVQSQIPSHVSRKPS